MGEQDRLLLRILRGTSDANIPFDGLCYLLRRLGFAERIRGSHHIFTKEGVEEILNLQPKGRQAKPYQVKYLMTRAMKSSSIGVRRTRPSLRKSPNYPAVQLMAPPTRKRSRTSKPSSRNGSRRLRNWGGPFPNPKAGSCSHSGLAGAGIHTSTQRSAPVFQGDVIRL